MLQRQSWKLYFLELLMAFTIVAKTSDIAEGQGNVSDAAGKSIALSTLAARFMPSITCTHKGGPLAEVN